MASLDPMAPIPAASLILARPDGDRLSICLLQRSQASRFMPGTYVFPGGWIDASDRDAPFWSARFDLSGEALANRMCRGLDAPTAVSAAVAAARETYEEAGILFAAPLDGSAVDPPIRGGFRRLFAEQGLILAISALSPWSHWITPVAMPKRFDTRFFLAVVPAGQAVRPDGRETTDAVWVHPRQALFENMAGRMPLSPPTLATLHELLEFPTVERLMTEAERRPWGRPILPRLVPLPKPHGAVIVKPWDPMYTQADIPIDAAELERMVLPVGEPFSRIWNLNGFCRPIRA